MQEVSLNEIKKQSNSMREALRELRTNIRFCGDDIKTILFTSVAPNEGKSTVVMDLARSMIESGNKILIIDSDMRKSVLVGRHRARSLDGKQIMGLSHFLSGQNSLEEVIYQTQFPNLLIMFAGPSVVNPTELLENRYYSEMIRSMRDVFDYILIDCAPLGAAIDAAVIAKECDGAVIVISQGEVSSKSVVTIKKQLEAADVRILGAVLNKVDVRKTGYYGKYYGSYYGEYYGRTGSGKNSPKRDLANEVNMINNLEEIKKASQKIEKDKDAENGEDSVTENSGN